MTPAQRARVISEASFSPRWQDSAGPTLPANPSEEDCIPSVCIKGTASAEAASEGVPSRKSGRWAGEGAEVRPHLLPELKEEVCARLPLAHMARAALVSKSWASTYASCLASRQQQLKALAPASAVSAVQASLNVWEYGASPGALPDESSSAIAKWNLVESKKDRLKERSSFNFEDGSNYGGVWSPYGILTIWSLPCGTRLITSCNVPSLRPHADGMPTGTLLVMLNFNLESAESLPWVVGLLLKLAQEVLPQKCGGQMGEEGGPRIAMKVRCKVEGETGWEDWAPLAPLCRAVRLTVSPASVLTLPWASREYAVIARSRHGWGSPVGLLHITARWWEPASCWSLGEHAGPRSTVTVSPDTLPHEPPEGPLHETAPPHPTDAPRAEQAAKPCMTHLGRIDEDSFDTDAEDDAPRVEREALHQMIVTTLKAAVVGM